jgi:superfamily II helicase
VIADKARFRATRKLERAAGFRLPDHVFSGGFLEAVGRGVNFENLDRRMQENLLAIFRDCMDCKCKNTPYCGCPERKFTLTIIELREMGLDHRQISAHLLEEYGIDLYPADILSFLEDSVHVLEAIRDVAELQGREKVAESAIEHIKKIEH